MEGKRIKVFGVVMVLLLVFSLAATFSVSSTVSAGTQKWSKISIPGTDDMQLAPGTDVGDIAVTPDGETLFAAVYNASGYADQWQLYTSVDGGYEWKVSGNFSTVTAAAGDKSPIVAIRISPAWKDDGIVVVATQDDVYYSENRGKAFVSMLTGALPNITSLDVALDANGDATYVIGTAGATGEVYILRGFGGWTPQYVEDPDKNAMSAYAFGASGGVLAVAFSPNYAEDGVVFAVVGGTAFMDSDGTHLRAESDITVNNWGSYIDDAHFVDKQTGDNIIANSACIAFADDYNSAPSVFVGLTAYLGSHEPKGDAFVVDLVMGTMGTSAVTDLNIRGVDSSTNVYSLAVSGPKTSAFMLAGLRDLSNIGPMSTWQGTVHYSNNGGESWLQSYKPPSGLLTDTTSYYSGHGSPTVVMAPDFADSGIAYCSTGYDPIFTSVKGDTAFSGVYVSKTEGTTWNGRGLLDATIDEIKDTVPSPDYDNDSTLFMVTSSTITPGTTTSGSFGLLWETKDGGKTWELILSMTLMIPVPGMIIDKIEIPATYPVEPSMFVTGTDLAIGGVSDTNALIARSSDEGNLWATTLKAPFIGTTAQVIRSWVVVDSETLIISSGSNIYKTTNMGAFWKLPTAADIDTAAGETVIDMQRYKDTNTLLVGTDRGNMFICNDWETDFSFTQVGETSFGAGHDVRVSFDTNFGDNGMVYAGVYYTPTDTYAGVWRVDSRSGDAWEQIVADIAVDSIRTDGNGILWALAWNDSLSLDVPYRCVNPTDLIDNIQWEPVTLGLPTDTGLWLDLETAPTNTYVFAIGGNESIDTANELWTYVDTLIKPTLISPADGTTAAGTIIQGNSLAHVSLMWNDLAKAKAYDYQVAYDTSFGSIAVEGTINGSQTAVSLFLGEKFYWRVRVHGSVWSQWSDTWTFTTPLGPTSSKPIVTYPGGIGDETRDHTSLTPTLTWTSAVEATGFELVLSKNCDWANPIVNLTGSSALGDVTAYKLPQTLEQGTSYCWKVRAINGNTATMSPWSDVGTFTTLVTPAVENTSTPVWVWVVIALSAVLLVGVVVLIVRTRRPV